VPPPQQKQKQQKQQQQKQQQQKQQQQQRRQIHNEAALVHTTPVRMCACARTYELVRVGALWVGKSVATTTAYAPLSSSCPHPTFGWDARSQTERKVLPVLHSAQLSVLHTAV
jgi:hypothetical protein